MSTERTTIQNSGRKGVPLYVLSYSGGIEKGRMLQLTQGLGKAFDEPGYIQLTKTDALALAIDLISWLNDE